MTEVPVHKMLPQGAEAEANMGIRRLLLRELNNVAFKSMHVQDRRIYGKVQIVTRKQSRIFTCF